MQAARWTNLICGALLVVAALGFLSFLPGNLVDYSREPEDVWIGGFWIGLLCLLAALCFVNAARARKAETPAAIWLTAVNLAALIGLVTLKALDTAYGYYDDPLLTELVVLCVLGPASAILASLSVSRPKRR